jgi:hypothetical protein
MPFFRDINISSPEIVVILYLIFLFVFKMAVNHTRRKIRDTATHDAEIGRFARFWIAHIKMESYMRFQQIEAARRPYRRDARQTDDLGLAIAALFSLGVAR